VKRPLQTGATFLERRQAKLSLGTKTFAPHLLQCPLHGVQLGRSFPMRGQGIGPPQTKDSQRILRLRPFEDIGGIPPQSPKHRVSQFPTLGGIGPRFQAYRQINPFPLTHGYVFHDMVPFMTVTAQPQYGIPRPILFHFSHQILRVCI